MKPVRLDPAAKTELLEVVRYYENVKHGLGKDFRTEFELGVKIIQLSPAAFGSAANVPGVRRLNLNRFHTTCLT